MDPITIIAIVAGVLIVALLVFIGARAVRAADRRRAELDANARGHREQADANVAKAQELAPKREMHLDAAARHEDEAARHAEQADAHREEAEELARRSELAGRAAARHDELAADAEQQLGRD